MPLSGLLSASEAGWPSVFYVFGAVGTAWSIAFILFVFEDPEAHPRIQEEEKNYIQKSLWGTANATVSFKLLLLINQLNQFFSLFIISSFDLFPKKYFYNLKIIA